MELLPISDEQFSKKDYWDLFFKQRRSAFEWYGDYRDLKPLLSGIVHGKDAILVIGCGNSEFSGQMYDDGCQDITNIDFSEVVIEEMVRRNKNRRSRMRWLCMDMLRMDFADGSFDHVIDKGALDALFADDSSSLHDDVVRMITEVKRVLLPGGIYSCISLLQPHVLRLIMESNGWSWNIYKFAPKESFSHCPFLCCGKSVGDDRRVETVLFFSLHGSILTTWFQAVETFFHSLDSPDPHVLSVDARVEGVQCRAELLFKLRTLRPSQHMEFQVSDVTKSDKPRYTISIVDAPEDGRTFTGVCAVFLVPQGRELEWLFATYEGQLQLAKSIQYRRLLVVQLNRDHAFSNVKDVQDELSPLVMELVPRSSKGRIPYMTVPEGVGERKFLCKLESRISGGLCVEEVLVEGKWLRRLVFSSNPNLIQTEVFLEDGIPSHKMLASDYHLSMTAALALYLESFLGESSSVSIGGIEEDRPMRVMIIGLGGGSLPIFIRRTFPNIFLEIVELDAVVVGIARKFFNFAEDAQTKVLIADGLQFIGDLAKNLIASKDSSEKKQCHRHAIILDVDSKDITVDMSCPPVGFVQEDFLRQCHHILSSEYGGLLIMNVSSRSQDTRNKVFATVDAVFCGGAKRDHFREEFTEGLEKEEKNILGLHLEKDETVVQSNSTKSLSSRSQYPSKRKARKSKRKT